MNKREIILIFGIFIVAVLSIYFIHDSGILLDNCKEDLITVRAHNTGLQAQILKKDSIQSIMMDDIRALISEDLDKVTTTRNRIDSLKEIRTKLNLYEIYN